MDVLTKKILSVENQKLILENLLGFHITLAGKYDGRMVSYGPGRKEIVRLIKDEAPIVRITDGSVTEGDFSHIIKSGKGLLYITQKSKKCIYTLIVLDQESMYATTSPFKKHRSSKKKSTRRKKRSTRKTSTRRV